MKIGLFNPYLDTMGGGERYFLTLAEHFLKQGHQVDLFWQGDKDVTKIKDRFDLNLSGVNFVENIFGGGKNKLQKFYLTSRYDLLFFLSDGSIPLSFAKCNILHFQTPFNDKSYRTLANKIKLARINLVVCNSSFTKRYIDTAFGVNSQVVYPPVDVQSFTPGKKENLILAVGRFFAPSHPKKQEVMIREFVELSHQGLKDWKFLLIGGVFPGSEVGVAGLRKKCQGYPIKIITDGSFEILKKSYARAKIFWHAAGYGEDLEKYPQKAEHFGITTVEAMSAGCVPVVFAGGGQTEIVREGIDGFFWTKPEELITKTLNLAKSSALFSSLSKQAIFRSQLFSEDQFINNWQRLLPWL